ncbi:MAG TPA: beta-N-acetylglucosaminidase [Peptococcaceae bacterium]|nr:beta-N-acetylglucosaminidase [Peptococcaceae bacterium]
MKKLILIFLLIAIAGALTGLFLANDGDLENILPGGLQPGEDAQQSHTSGSELEQPPEDAFAIRGIVEGFYGTPWTFAQRKDMLSFMEANHFNTYVYAPKDDPYQRTNWWELYPTAEFAELRELVANSKDKNINFVYSLSPGIPQPLSGQKLTQNTIDNSLTFTSEADFAKLLAKIRQVSSAGVNTFMLSFDDVERFLKNEDKAVYGDNYPKAHIDLANKLLREGRKDNPDFQLWFAPTAYYGLKDNAYWQELRANLHPEIKVIWTGSWVLAKEITTEEVKQVETLLGRRPLIWDNYPVNDYTYAVDQKPRLLLGPVEHRSPDLSKHTEGIIANPMIQPEASKIPLATIGEYLWHPLAYSPEEAWLKAVQTAAQAPQGEYQALWKFCTYSAASILTDNWSKSGFSSLAESFWLEYNPERTSNSEEKLKEELRLLAQLPLQIEQTVPNKALVQEINPWLEKLALAGETGLKALEYLKLPRTDPAKAMMRGQLEQKLAALKANPIYIGAEIILFIETCSQIQI